MSSSSSSIDTIVIDTAGDQAEFTLRPGGSSGISVTTAGGAVNSVTATATQVALSSQAAGNSGSVQAIASSAAVLVTGFSSTGAVANVVVQPGRLAAITNGGGTGETSVEHDVGFVNTTNRNGAPNDNYSAGSSNKVGYYSGIGVFQDNNAHPPVAQGTVNCQVPMALPAGIPMMAARLEIVLLVKCIANGVAGDFYTPLVGDYFLQKFYTTWINAGGTVRLANNNASGSSPIDNFTGVATLDTSGVPFHFSASKSGTYYKLGTALVATPGSGANLLIQATPGTYDTGIITTVNVGTAVVQIYVTAWYN